MNRPFDRLLKPAWYTATMAVVVLSATLVRLFWITEQPLWFDEVNTLYRAAGGSFATVLSLIAGDVQAPLYDFGMALVVWLFGDGLLVARLPPLLAGVMLIPVVAALVRFLGGGHRAALLAAGWAAFDPYLVRYGVEARPYTWLALFSGLTLLSTLRLVDRRGEGAWRLAVTGSGLVLCHYYGVVAYAAVLLYLAANLGAVAPRLQRALGAALAPLALLALWSPVALHQLSQRSMSSIYHSLDMSMALQILDAQGLTAPLAISGDQPGLVMAGRLVLACLLLAGTAVLWRGSARAPAAPGPAATNGRLSAMAWVGGLVLVGVGLWLPGGQLAGVASTLIKGGRPLDAQNLAFLEQMMGLVQLAGWGLCAAGLLWPAVVRHASSCTRRTGPVFLLWALLVIPLGLAVLLDGLGKPTLSVRNTIFMAPAVIALAALGLDRLPRLARVLTLSLLVVICSFSTAHLDGFLRRLPWDEASTIVEASGAEPLAHPPWMARCIEYHGERPWASVYGSYRPGEVERWAAAHPAVALVAGFEQLADSSSVRAALQRSHGDPQTTHLRGLKVVIYRR